MRAPPPTSARSPLPSAAPQVPAGSCPATSFQMRLCPRLIAPPPPAAVLSAGSSPRQRPASARPRPARCADARATPARSSMTTRRPAVRGEPCFPTPAPTIAPALECNFSKIPHRQEDAERKDQHHHASATIRIGSICAPRVSTRTRHRADTSGRSLPSCRRARPILRPRPPSAARPA